MRGQMGITKVKEGGRERERRAINIIGREMGKRRRRMVGVCRDFSNLSV